MLKTYYFNSFMLYFVDFIQKKDKNKQKRHLSKEMSFLVPKIGLEPIRP